MRASCISYPKDEPLVLIRTSQLPLCDNNHCAAALLSFFEYWHNIKLGQQEQAEHANRVAEMHGEEGTQDTSLLQFQTEKGLEKGLLNLYGRTMIRRALTILIQKGFITVHENPHARYRFDKTHYFLFHPEIVSAQLIDISDEVKVTHRSAKNNCSCVKNNASSGKNNASIPEITSEISSREEDLSPPARAPVNVTKRSHRCHADYEPSPAVRQWAQAKHPEVDFDEALDAMRDWEFADRKSDWDATLKMWIRREAKALKQTPSYRRAPPATRAEQRKAAEDQSNRELEDLVLGRNTHNSVWQTFGRDGADLREDVGPRRQGRLPDGA